MNANRFAKLAEQVVNKYRETGNVIHVRMGDNHIAHAALLRVAERNPNAAGVDGDAVINHKAGKALRQTNAAT